MKHSSPLISVIVPLHNEAAGLERFHQALREQLLTLREFQFEVIYCDDGSVDGTSGVLHEISKDDAIVRVVSLSRNFGKELAITAGLRHAQGVAAIALDGDGQHPIELLPEFIAKWQAGAKVVVGLRSERGQATALKRIGSKVFSRIIRFTTRLQFMPNATDYRLVDRVVIDEFNMLTEHNRISRGLIDWLGYEQSYITFTPKPRLHDQPAYSFSKLSKLAVDSIISLSSSPLYVVAIIGAIILPISIILGLVMIFDALAGDPFGWEVTGSGYLAVALLFLSSLILMTQGIIGLYLMHVHSETQNRPLYIIDKANSRRLDT